MDIILKKNILEKNVCFYSKKTNFSCRVGGGGGGGGAYS